MFHKAVKCAIFLAILAEKVDEYKRLNVNETLAG